MRARDSVYFCAFLFSSFSKQRESKKKKKKVYKSVVHMSDVILLAVVQKQANLFSQRYKLYTNYSRDVSVLFENKPNC